MTNLIQRLVMCNGDEIVAQDRERSEPAAIKLKDQCRMCGKEALVWSIDGSDGEYSGANICGPCLCEMARALEDT